MLCFCAASRPAAAQASPVAWALPNFAQRLEVTVTNPSERAVNGLVIVPVAEARQVAPRFPGSLSIAVLPDQTLRPVPSQADDLDGDGSVDEFVFQVPLGPRESRPVHIYYSTTLSDTIPWPKRVHASHRYGYNQSTSALESESIGYRAYGFFLDIQGRRKGSPGLFNSLAGWFGTQHPTDVGFDIVHFGDTLGLGGVFLRAGGQVFTPPLNVPDYTHKPEPLEGAPRHRVIATGPVRAMVELGMDRWKVGPDEVVLCVRYAIAAGTGSVECLYEVLPLRLSREYEAGAGIRRLPQVKTDHAAGRIAVSGEQSPKTGPLAMALFFDPASASRTEPVISKEDGNECIRMIETLQPGRAVRGRFWLAAAWSGSGIDDLFLHLRNEETAARTPVSVSGYRFTRTPHPNRVEGEAY